MDCPKKKRSKRKNRDINNFKYMEPYILIFVVILLICLEIFFVLRKRRKRFSQKEIAFLVSEWESILKRVPVEPRYAILDADKLLDYVLKKRGYVGTLGEKLKKSEKCFSNINEIWNAHRLRNRVVHEVGFKVTEKEIRNALNIIRRGLVDLGVEL